ncbi:MULTISPECIES: hypothetical protein [Streptomyces]|uniref:hypothetical protein n=1 Tax=Streptomyces TaxID=1883 RepID=UPI00369EEE1B
MTDRVNAELETPRSFDATWFVTRGAAAAWIFINDVQGAQSDAESAVSDGDWGTCVEASLDALRSVLHCELVLDGYRGSCVDGEIDLHATYLDSPTARALRDLPHGHLADETTARQCLAAVTRATGQLEDRLPLHIPVVRTAEGFFPSVRMAGDIERLRTKLGFEPMDWNSWSAF